MTQSGHFNHLETDDFQAVNLPYADGQISLYVFLPKNNLKKFLGNLTPANWEQWLTRFKSANGTVELPRFKLSNEYKLNSTVEALGMPLAFTPRADLSGIAAEPLYIGWVRQKTFVEVNEEGTEAAAVTGIGVRASSVRREEPPFQMIVDHPFFVAIREARTGAVLFVGVIGDPR